MIPAFDSSGKVYEITHANVGTNTYYLLAAHEPQDPRIGVYVFKNMDREVALAYSVLSCRSTDKAIPFAERWQTFIDELGSRLLAKNIGIDTEQTEIEQAWDMIFTKLRIGLQDGKLRVIVN